MRSVVSEHSIGVFDSGVGGLSVLRSLREELPHENFVYVADSGHAPYGERDDGYVVDRSRAITDYLITRHRIKALVIACNTATAAAIHILRRQHPTLPIIGVEPALKPAVAASATHRIGVMATRGTLSSSKYTTLLASLHGQAEFVSQACDGLAHAVEHDDTTKTIALCTHYISQMGPFGTQSGQIDTLVLGCTHYAFAGTHLRTLVGPAVHILNTGEPVAKRTRHVLAACLSQRQDEGSCSFETSGAPAQLQAAVQRWLQLPAPVRDLPK
ncbi:glutamate racemase [Rhodoferax sp.]|uniref:glutamate racemase n=1 Tax=Rhodoferax sp. TaxID=50421 RepID=UPI002768DCA8|nr:glutamate racemase [Rhodoferax sp.]